MSARTVPNLIYKYRSYTAADLSNLVTLEKMQKEVLMALESRSWFSRVSSQNDPLDTNPVYINSSLKQIKIFMENFWKVAGKTATFANEDFVGTARKLGYKKSAAKRHLNDHSTRRKLARDSFLEFRNNHLISCFTEDPFNILMWSYYGVSHQSFCYEFELDPSRKEYGDQVIANVRYLNLRPEISTIDMLNRMAAANYPESFQQNSEDQERVDNATFLAKSIHWAHEKEWRSIRTPADGIGFHSIYPYRLRRIIMGAQSEKSLMSEIKKLLDRNVLVVKCSLSRSRYEVIIGE